MDKMARLFLIAVGGLSTVILFGAVEMDDNLVMNGKMNSDQMEFPPYWAPDAGSNVKLGPASGPGGMPSLILLPGTQRECAVRQNGLNTASNGVYRLSFMYKATGADFSACSIGIAAAGWNAYSGIELKERDCGWKRFEGEVVSRPWKSADTHHFLVFYTIGLAKGSVEFADISLCPANAATAEATDVSEAAKGHRLVRLVPMYPRLDEIPAKNRTVKFKFFGVLPKGRQASDFVARFSFGNRETEDVDLNDKEVLARVPDGINEGVVTASIIAKSGGEPPVFSRSYEFAVLPELVYPVVEKRLNNLCREIFCEKVLSGLKTWKFGVKRRSWYYISVPGTAELDGRAIAASGGECFRRLDAGDHELVTHGGAGTVVLRRIAEIFNYCPYQPASVAQAGVYDQAFWDKYVFPNSTTQCGGWPNDQQRRHVKDLGLEYVFDTGIRDLKDDDDWLRRLEGCAGMKNPLYDGVSGDETFLHEGVNNARATSSLWRATKAKFTGKGVYTWMVGNPSAAGSDTDFISAAVNSCGGRSRILYEMYMPSQPTEEAARNYIRTRMGTTAAMYESFLPGVLARFGFVFGNFNQYPAITDWTDPATDYKYYMDLQWQILATDPAFDGIGLCGYWGSYYCDEEIHRWSFMLTRHYVIEGSVESLARKHGLSFRGLLRNGDFENGLDGWRVSPGVKVAKDEKIPLYEGRFERVRGEGATYAEFPVRAADGDGHVLTYALEGLVPGRLYALQFCSFDVVHVKSGAKGAVPTGVRADLGTGAQRVELLSWTYEGVGANKYSVKRPGINVHHYVFRATSNMTEIAISSRGSPAKMKVGVNAVSVCPYVAADSGDTCPPVAYGDDLRDRCWMFGHDSGQHDGPKNAFNIPLSPKVTIGEACALMGVSNVCVCVWHMPDDAYLEQFRSLKRVVWAIDNGWIKRNVDGDEYPARLKAGIDRMKKMPNLVGFEYDDFFNGYAETGTYKDRLADGTEVEVLTGARNLAELREARRILKSQCRPVDMRLVLYTSEVACGRSVLPVVDMFDTVTLWTWAGSDLKKLRGRVEAYRKLVGNAKTTFLGIYMWNFGEGKPIGVEAMRGQLDLGLELFRAGKIDGFVFHCTPLVNKNLPEVDMVRRWIAEHGEERCGMALR